MNLSDFANMIFTDEPPCRICVFSDEGSRDNYRYGDTTFTPVLAIETDYKLAYVLNEKFSKAKVLHFFVQGKGEVDVIIDEDTQEDYQ